MSLIITKSRAVGMSELPLALYPLDNATFPKWGSVNPEAPAQAATEYRMKSVAERQARQMGMTGIYSDALTSELMGQLHDALFGKQATSEAKFDDARAPLTAEQLNYNAQCSIEMTKYRAYESFGMRLLGDKLVSVSL